MAHECIPRALRWTCTQQNCVAPRAHTVATQCRNIVGCEVAAAAPVRLGSLAWPSGETVENQCRPRPRRCAPSPRAHCMRAPFGVSSKGGLALEGEGSARLQPQVDFGRCPPPPPPKPSVSGQSCVLISEVDSAPSCLPRDRTRPSTPRLKYARHAAKLGSEVVALSCNCLCFTAAPQTAGAA